MSARSIFIERYMDPADPCESWLRRFLVKEEVGSTTVAGQHTSCHGDVSNFLWLLCIPMDRGRRSEMRASARCSRISAGVPKAFRNKHEWMMNYRYTTIEKILIFNITIKYKIYLYYIIKFFVSIYIIET